ncbi:MAG: hypothetical protein ABSG22_10740 [Sedimentisphaerales bacterium]|jgi:hypothetical protein
MSDTKIKKQKANNKKHECKRCGRCCVQVGLNFWGNSEHPLVRQFHKIAENIDNGEPCLMYAIIDNTPTCLIWEYIGRKGLPEACRDYPFNEKKCFRENTQRKNEETR